MKTLFKKKQTKSFLKLSLFAFFFSLFSYAQEQPVDSLKVNNLKEVTVLSIRATEKTPITFSNVSKEQIEPRNLGQDIPVLLNYLPSVVTTTDAGNGVGYTSMRVRGSDGSRINVTLNGVPFNDSESHGTFFVNLPDFASSLESVQLQRGVGTSTNGAGAFGASLNMETKSYQVQSHAEISNSAGSFGTRKHTLSFGTGLHNNFEFNGRVSQIASDGYIDRASSNMFGYFFNTNYVKENTLIKLIAFGGKEKTYQAWYGLEDLDKLENDRTYNSAGLYFDEFGNEQFYDDETDNYWQNHFQLHWSEKWSDKWNSNLALHYTLGKGYYKQYKEDQTFSDYGLSDFGVNSTTDLIRKRWLDNDFFGTTFSLNYKTDKSNIQFGGAANRYLGKHYGEVVWTQYYVPSNNRYYNTFGNKDDVNVYAKLSQDVSSKMNIFADLQYRLVYYQASGVQATDVNDTFRFFNPKVGANFKINLSNSIYAYAGVANKEPRRDDYENESTKPERLIDFELGWKYNTNKIKVNTNAFYMDYKDQLVMTGALNNVGAPIFTNSGKSYRLGLEVDALIKVMEKITLRPNITISQNKNKNFYFERDGVLTNLGNTNIAFSPNFVFGSVTTYSPTKNLDVSFLTKLVSKQYMGNIDSENSLLESYSNTDLNISYDWAINKGIKSIVFSALVNNILDEKYESNGYFYTYDDTWSGPGTTTIEGTGYYPQAGVNFLLGMTLKF